MGENEVCNQHAMMCQSDQQLSKDVGKVSQRLAIVEENTKHIPKMAEDIEKMSMERSRTAGFVAGVSLVISLIVSFLGYGISLWWQTRGH